MTTPKNVNTRDLQERKSSDQSSKESVVMFWIVPFQLGLPRREAANAAEGRGAGGRNTHNLGHRPTQNRERSRCGRPRLETGDESNSGIGEQGRGQ